jgi:hypothetical protein
MSQANTDFEILDYLPEDDGYTLPAYIKPIPRLHNEVRFRFRPLDIIERSVLMAFKDRSYEKEIAKKFCEILAVKISEWSIQMRSGDTIVPMPIDPIYIQKLKPPLWIRLVNIVIWGMDGGDLDPAASLKEMEKQLDVDVQAIVEGARVIDARVEDLRKN